MKTIDFEKDSLTEEGRIEIVNDIIRSSGDVAERANTQVCWDYYNNKLDQAKYDYLRKSGQYEYPAKVRRIPKQSTYINNLVSQQSQRPFAFSVWAVDDQSSKKKYDQVIKGMFAMAEERAAMAYYDIQGSMQALDMQKQQLIESIKVEPQSPEEKAMIEQIQANLPNIETQFAFAKRQLERQYTIKEEEVRKLERYYQYEYKDTTEIIGQKLARVLRQDLNVAYKEMQGVKHRCVTGLEYFYVDYAPGEKLPRFEVLNEMKVHVPESDIAGWTQFAPWVRIEEEMSFDQVLSEFAPYMTSEEIERLKNSPIGRGGPASGAFIGTPNGALSRDTVRGVYGGSSVSTGGYVVNRVWWRAPRLIRYKKEPSQTQKGKESTHFILNGKTIIHEEDFKYNFNDRKWVSRTNPNVEYKASEVETVNREKGEYIKEKLVYDRYKGFMINNDVVKGFRDPIQPRMYSDLAQVMLPVVGRRYNSTTDTPYSLIWNTIELQETYDLVHYHRELLLAISGVSGVVMDISQKPEAMSEEEWYYQMKMGRFLIETLTKSGRKNTGFNQFSRVDMSLSASIQYLDQMLRSTDESMGMVMGLTRQRLGQTVASDQVGTFEMSRNLSMLTTEVIFREHDETMRQALGMCLNIASRYCWEKGALLQLRDDGVQYVTVSEGQLKGIDFAFKIENNTQESFNLDEMRKLGMNLSLKGQISFKEYVSIIRSNSVRELEIKLESLAKEAEEMLSLRQNNASNQQAEIDERKARFQQEIESIRQSSEKELKLTLQKMQDVYKEAQLQLQAETLDFNKQKWEDERALKIADLQSESQIENRIVDENRRAALSADQVNLLSTQLNAMIEMLRINSNDKNASKKIDVDREKVRKQTREHASDVR